MAAELVAKTPFSLKRSDSDMNDRCSKCFLFSSIQHLGLYESAARRTF